MDSEHAALHYVPDVDQYIIRDLGSATGVCVYAYVYICVCCVYVCLCACVCVCVCMCVCVRVCVCVCLSGAAQSIWPNQYFLI